MGSSMDVCCLCYKAGVRLYHANSSNKDERMGLQIDLAQVMSSLEGFLLRNMERQNSFVILLHQSYFKYIKSYRCLIRPEVSP